MIAHYRKMFAYNFWANQLFIDCLDKATVANAKSFLLMSHLLTAEEVWLCRLQGREAPLQRLWKEYPIGELQQKTEERKADWETFLKNIEEAKLRAPIQYKDSRGQTFTTEIGDVLNHVINHSTYHRAQMAFLFRQELIEPPATDYILYIRQQPLKGGGAAM